MITKETLIQKYVKEKKSLRTIAEELSCSKKKISHWMTAHNIQKRSLKEARNNRSARGREFRDIVDIEELIQFYEKGNSIRKCAEHFGIGYTAAQDRLKTYNASRKPWDHRVGSKHSKNTKTKMSRVASKQIEEGTRIPHCQGNTYYCSSPNQGQIRVRSSWERDYADYLCANNIDFYYENKVFELSDGKSYIPDFYLTETDEYIEIKGYLTDYHREKYKLFKSEYPDIDWKMLRKEHLSSVLKD